MMKNKEKCDSSENEHKTKELIEKEVDKLIKKFIDLNKVNEEEEK